MAEDITVKRRGNTVEITLVNRLAPGRKVMLKTTGWGSNTYVGEVVAFVPKNEELPLPEGVKVSASPVSGSDRYLVKATGQRGVGEFRKPRYFAPLASRLENDNHSISN